MTIKSEKIKKKVQTGGFTLVELIISVGIFSLLMVLSVGALLAVVSANKNAQGIKSAVENLNFSLETMARTIRSGSNYVCEDTNSDGKCNHISFYDRSGAYEVFNENVGVKIDYYLYGATLMRTVSGANPVAMTSSDVSVNLLRFDIDIMKQPNVLIIIDGLVNYKNTLETKFQIETLAVQRYFNK